MSGIMPDQVNPRESIVSPFPIDYQHDADAIRAVRIWRSERLLKLPAAADDKQSADWSFHHYPRFCTAISD